MSYSLIYADPPWQYRDKANSGKRGACHKYDVMSLDAICRLPVTDLAFDDCLLAMWWVSPMPEEALRVVKAWGFKLKTMCGFTWHKLTVLGKDHFGMGHYTRCNAENCLFATRGRPRVVSHSVPQLIVSPVREHSQKPDEAAMRLVQLMGDVPRVELFARGYRPGWDAWGDEAVNPIEWRTAE
jgi:N6-adenosine-specific RNA methylase IME4